MCLIVVAWQKHPCFDLLLAANRDEFHERAALPAHAWDDPPGLFAGRDVKAGGAWCGADRTGRFAAVTNVRDPGAATGQHSRGNLVRDYFAADRTAHDWAMQVANEGTAYSPFNLLIGDRDSLYYVSNRDTHGPRPIRPGVIAISNGHWGEHWPKTDRAERTLTGCLAEDAIDSDTLLALLADTERAPDCDLPATGIDRQRERFLSPLFIQGQDYGTRASTIIRRKADRCIEFVEQGFDPVGQAVHGVHHNWLIETRST